MEIKVIFHITGKTAQAKLLNPDFFKFFYHMQLVAGRDRKIFKNQKPSSDF